MSNKKTNVVYKPKARFPEFQADPEWSERELNEAFLPILREKKKPNTPYTGLGIRSHGKGTFLKCNELPEKNAMEVLYEVLPNDLVVNITFAWEGAIAIAGGPDAGALVSHRFPTYVFKQNNAIPDFFRYLILDKQFVYKLGVISPGGAGRNRVLNKNDFLKLKVLLPQTDEQQKIADCLSSVDELITAQAQKVEALKAHKKGLMQLLFPAEGKTLPKLRFPEFSKSGGWEPALISSLCKPYSGGTPSTNKRQYYGGSIPFIRSAEIDLDHTELTLTEEGLSNSSAKMVQTGDVLVALYGANSGEVAIAKIDGAINQAILCLRTPNSNQYVYHYLIFKMMSFVNTHIQGGQGNLSGEIVRSISIMMPPTNKEKQKIADCLSSIDALIAAQAQKVEALKTHKRGLMQQLFPVPEAEE